MKLRVLHEYVPPGFDLVRWLKALRRKWFLFVVSILFFCVGYLYISKFFSGRYHISSWFYVSKDMESEVHDAENLLRFLKLYSQQNNIENHIGELKSNSLLYNSVLGSSRYVRCNNFSSKNTIQVLSENIPIDCNIKITRVGKDSLHVKLAKKTYDIFSKEKTVIIYQEELELDKIILESELISVNGIEFQFLLDSEKEFEKQSFSLRNPLKVTNELEQGLRIKTLNKGAAMVTLEMSSNVPESDKRLLTELTDNYLARRKRETKALGDAALGGIVKQLRETSRKAETLISEQSNSKKEHKYFNLDKQFQSLLKNQISSLNELDDHYTEISLLRKFISQASESGIFEFSTINTSEGLIKELAKKHNKLAKEISTVSIMAGYKNPKLAELSDKLSFVENTIIKVCDQEILRKEMLSKSITNHLKNIETEMSRMLDLVDDSWVLERSLSHFLEEVESLLKSSIDIKMAMNYEDSNFKVLQPAIAKKKPFGPLKAEALVVIILLALLFPVMFIFMDAQTGSRIYSGDQILSLINRSAIVTLERFNFSKRKPFTYALDSSLMSELFLIGAEEFSSKMKLSQKLKSNPRGLVFSFYQLYANSCGIKYSKNLCYALRSLNYEACEVNFGDEENSDRRHSYLYPKTSLADADSLEEMLNHLRKDYDVILLKMPTNIPSSKVMHLSEVIDESIGLVKEHQTRENNILAIYNSFKLLPKSEVNFVYFSGFFKPIQIIRPEVSAYVWKYNILDRTWHLMFRLVRIIRSLFQWKFLQKSR